MKEFLKEWNEKYPKSFDKFNEFLENFYKNVPERSIYYDSENNLFGYVLFELCDYDYTFKLEELTGLLDKYFMNNKINVIKRPFGIKNTSGYIFYVNLKQVLPCGNVSVGSNSFNDYNKGLKQAYLKAAEIKEKELN